MEQVLNLEEQKRALEASLCLLWTNGLSSTADAMAYSIKRQLETVEKQINEQGGK